LLIKQAAHDDKLNNQSSTRVAELFAIANGKRDGRTVRIGRAKSMRSKKLLISKSRSETERIQAVCELLGEFRAQKERFRRNEITRIDPLLVQGIEDWGLRILAAKKPVLALETLLGTRRKRGKRASASLAIIGGMVPDRLREALAEADDGLAARFFYVWPEPRPIAPLKKCGDTEAAQRREKLAMTARKLQGSDNNGLPAPRALRLDVNAVDLFDEQRQEVMRLARAASGLAAGWHGKNPGRILRLALVYELLDWAARGDEPREPTSVAADAVVRAGGYIDYAAAMLERVTGGLAVGRAEADAAQVARHVLAIAQGAPPHARLKPLNERSLYQTRGFTWARGSKRRTEAFTTLEGASWVRPFLAHGYARPRGDWEVNPLIVEAKE
jgi:hypothetical protein